MKSIYTCHEISGTQSLELLNLAQAFLLGRTQELAKKKDYF